jgi:tRNA-guanine family transglycosylase
MLSNLHQGYAEDLIVSVALGVDMFDCVYPTRTAVRNENIGFDSIEIRECDHSSRSSQPAKSNVCD